MRELARQVWGRASQAEDAARAKALARVCAGQAGGGQVLGAKRV